MRFVTCEMDGTTFVGVMPPEDYVAGVIDKIAQAVIQSWQMRAPGGIGFGLGQAGGQQQGKREQVLSHGRTPAWRRR